MKISSRSGEMAQRLRALAALAKDLGSDPGTHARQLTTTSNTSSRGPKLHGHPHACVHRHT